MKFLKNKASHLGTRVKLQIKLQVQKSTQSTLKKDVWSSTQVLAVVRVMDGQDRLRKIAFRLTFNPVK